MSIDRTLPRSATPPAENCCAALRINHVVPASWPTDSRLIVPAVVKHTRMLGRAGLIRAKKVGRERIYELAPGGRAQVEALIKRLEEVGAFWDTALGAFKRYLEANR